MTETVLTVSRWRRYGHDRLHVATPTGAEVGWFDLRTGEHALDRPELEAAFTHTVRDWLDHHPGVAGAIGAPAAASVIALPPPQPR